MQNPTRKVKSLYCVWLPRPQYGQPEIFLLDRVPSEVCEKIVNDYVDGKDNAEALKALEAAGFEHGEEHKRVEGEVPEAVQELIDELVTVKKQLDIYTQREKEIKEQLLATMVARGEDKWQSDTIQVSKVAASVSVSVDSKALKEKYPEVFDECKKESKRKEYVTYKLI
jgi:predicted phage-related endonuclease